MHNQKVAGCFLLLSTMLIGCLYYYGEEVSDYSKGHFQRLVMKYHSTRFRVPFKPYQDRIKMKIGPDQPFHNEMMLRLNYSNQSSIYSTALLSNLHQQTIPVREESTTNNPTQGSLSIRRPANEWYKELEPQIDKILANSTDHVST